MFARAARRSPVVDRVPRFIRRNAALVALNMTRGPIAFTLRRMRTRSPLVLATLLALTACDKTERVMAPPRTDTLRDALKQRFDPQGILNAGRFQGFV